MNRREIRDAVRGIIGEDKPGIVMDPDDPEYDPDKSGDFWTDSFINKVIDEGYRKFNRRQRWSWLWARQAGITVSAGTADIELIDEIPLNRQGYLRLVQDDQPNHEVLPERVGVAEGIRRRHEHRNREGTPEFWFAARSVKNEYDDGDEARAMVATLVPAPSVAYDVEFYYMMDPPGLADDEEDPEMPAMYHDAIVAWAAAKCFVREGDRQAANTQFEIFNDILADAEAEHKKLANDERPMAGRPPFRLRSWRERHMPENIGV